MKKRIFLTITVIAAAWIAVLVFEQKAIPSNSADLAIEQVKENGAREELRIQEQIQNWGRIVAGLIAICFIYFIWKGKIMKKMSKKMLLFLLFIEFLPLTGCMKPPLVEKYESVANNETAFVIQLEGSKQAKIDSLDSLMALKVMAKRIDLPQRFQKTGRFSWQGKWIPTVQVLKVNRARVTREWTAESASGTSRKDEGIWIESKDSIGFSTGFNCTAMIEEQNAAVFLYNYPSGSLANVMDSQIRTEIQSVAAEVAAKYSMDDCREKKNEIIERVREVVIPKYAKTGITITTIGMYGGFKYESGSIQTAIDNVFVAQQEKNTATALFQAQQTKNNTIEMAAVGLKNAAITKADGEAKAIALVAEALKVAQSNPVFIEVKKLEVELARLSKWNGSYPQWYMGNEANGLGLIVNPPK